MNDGSNMRHALLSRAADRVNRCPPTPTQWIRVNYSLVAFDKEGGQFVCSRHNGGGGLCAQKQKRYSKKKQGSFELTPAPRCGIYIAHMHGTLKVTTMKNEIYLGRFMRPTPGSPFEVNVLTTMLYTCISLIHRCRLWRLAWILSVQECHINENTFMINDGGLIFTFN